MLAWGDDTFKQVSGVPNVTTATQVAVGLYHAVAILQDGSVVRAVPSSS